MAPYKLALIKRHHEKLAPYLIMVYLIENWDFLQIYIYLPTRITYATCNLVLKYLLLYQLARKLLQNILRYTYLLFTDAATDAAVTWEAITEISFHLTIDIFQEVKCKLVIGGNGKYWSNSTI